MPRDTIDVVADIYAAWNAGDWGLEHFHPDVDWDFGKVAAPDQTEPIRGRDALLDEWRRFWGAWRSGARWEVEELRPLSEEQVLVSGRLYAVGRSSGVESSAPVFHLWTVREGQVVRFVAFEDRAAAVKAVGI
jgi:ketosteroid isomerase-like protein